jgi:hypothetical protein
MRWFGAKVKRESALNALSYGVAKHVTLRLRSGKAGSRGSPRFLTAQGTLVVNDKQNQSTIGIGQVSNEQMAWVASICDSAGDHSFFSADGGGAGW